MLVFPGCKINLGLRILNKRTDGYHNLETVFYPVPFSDALEIISSQHTGPAIFTSSGLTIDGASNDNLCVKAYWLIKKDFPTLPDVKIHLHKCIPMGAGLGGGSADAAFALQLLNNMFSLQLSSAQLISYAAQLGSDCPFFILNSPCVATGRGEILRPLTFDLAGYTLVLINPGIHINTKEAFEALRLNNIAGNNVTIAEIIQQPVLNWRNLLVNDFEIPVSNRWPVIKEIKDRLYKTGAVYAAMTGSGSMVFGLFEKQAHANITIDLPFFVRLINL